MYFWKLDLLKKQLIANGLTEAQGYSYMLVYTIFGAIAIEMMAYIPHESLDGWTYFASLLNILIPAVGTMMAFRANGGASGTQFLSRYISISLISSIRYLVLILLLMIPLTIVAIMLQGTGDIFESRVFELLFHATYVLLYLYIVKHVGEVAKAARVSANN
ncbi:hypothetical protein [Undibacterium pigrum]|uniref:Uncharacterized protein n=1 Tax=Undibacterium pigrum TaxID=401470 RepID=A0A318IPK3_9BURK|nr:hypothetical protein [Undibacterium pigrum]PXX37325.1 hypothetical protein DFR42_11619 [Undibacterium pigrum]